MKIRTGLATALLPVLALSPACAKVPWRTSGEPAELLANVRQLTFDGRRSGEGYWSADGTQLVFQSEREPGNPFYQIYRMELGSGAVTRVSPGAGKTTCAWFHPSGRRVLFASTHQDPNTQEAMRAERERRASGEERRYAWDFDPEFELYSARPDGSDLVRLTASPGYDAEGSYSTNGDWIVFASNRHAWLEPLDAAQRERFARDPSWGMEIYRMRSDGTGLQRLTHAPGYDGGPFWSPDGSRIVWRRFDEEGATAEIYTMAADGTDVRQITRLGAMSWAPFYHPSGAYLIFATNRHGFANFELYLVDAAGRREPMRVTDRPGFDGLPAFSPDGTRLAWSRAGEGERGAQIFLADWDHAAALRRLGLPAAAGRIAHVAPPPAALAPEELRRHVERLTADDMGGRATGTPGELRATGYVASELRALGLVPAGDDGDFFQTFEFTSGVALGPDNALELRGAAGGPRLPDRDWRPLAFSRAGRAGPAPVVFAGYGIVAPAHNRWPAYDSYAELDVSGRWVLTLRYLPEQVPTEYRQYLNRYAGLRYKAMLARERGALGLIVVTGPRSPARDPLVPLEVDVALAGTSVFALSVTPEVAGSLLGGRDLEALQRALDGGEQVPGFEVPGLALGASIDLVYEKSAGRNVLARRPGRDPSAAPVVIGAHVDHIGRGSGGTSLARDDEQGLVHPGADDNASGIAALLAIAAWLGEQEPPPRDVLLAAWSGEELGLLGSNHWTEELPDPDPHGSAPRRVAAYLNMDMVGRFDRELVLHGTGSSPAWESLIERANAVVGLPLSPQPESYLPTDATPFYLKGVPVLSAFTGSHAEYHTPRDTPDRLDYAAAARTAWLMGRVARDLARSDALPEYVALEHPGSGPTRGSIRVYLGTIPNYGRSDVSGVALSGVAPGGPAERAGVRAGDVIVELGGQTVENIYDYTYALDGLAVGEPARLVVLRDGRRVELEIVPEPRE